MTTYLVTGATGFVGHTLVRRLVRDGHTVRVVARPENPDLAIEAQCEVRVASLGDPAALAEAASGTEVVFHCASESSSLAPAEAYAWINVAATENVINAARHAGVARLVHLSCTDTSLANRDRLSWRENQALGEAPLDAMCRSKLLAEELALNADDDELEVCVIKPAWVWGPGDRRTLPALCREAARGGIRMCGNGDNLLPTVHVDNLVEALLLAAAAERAAGRAYHVLDGEVLSAREFFGSLSKALGMRAPVPGFYALTYAGAWLRERLGRQGLVRADVVRRGRSALFDGAAAVHDLGYTPKVSVEQGMAGLSAWCQQQGGCAAIARMERKPSSHEDVAALMRIATATAT